VILAGDIGGTKTRLGLFRAPPGDGRRPELVAEGTYPSADYPGLGPVVARFLECRRVTAALNGATVEAACFGVAGPVLAERVEATNLAWTVDSEAVSEATGIERVLLVNDLVATAHGIPALGDERLELLNPEALERSIDIGRLGGQVGGNAALIAPGTGLGMALIPTVGGEPVPVPSEGGHMDYPARTDEEIELLRYLRRRFGRVSVERVASGIGLPLLYDFVRSRGGAREDPALARRMAEGNPNAEITRAAIEGGDRLAGQAVDLFVAALGAAAGNLALVGTATAGVYLGGGIPPKILPKLRDGRFLDAYTDKGRFREYVEAIPVRVILDPDTAMLGAARAAAHLLIP
jgi:glucokinase